MYNNVLGRLQDAILNIAREEPKLGSALTCLALEHDRNATVPLDIIGGVLYFCGAGIRGLGREKLKQMLRAAAKRTFHGPRNLGDHRYTLFPFTEKYGEIAWLPLRDHALDGALATVSLRFFNLIDELVARIEDCDAVVGCCPWISSPRIQDALNGVEQYSVVSALERERPPKAHQEFANNFPIEIAELLQDGDVDFSFKDWSSARSIEYILSAKQAEAEAATQRLHTKFLIFLKRIDDKLVPHEVVLGSANYTENADLQHEMLCFMQSPQVSEKMMLQWYQMLILAGYQRDPELIQFSYNTFVEDQFNVENGDAAFYNYDPEAALFGPEAYFDGKLTSSKLP